MNSTSTLLFGGAVAAASAVVYGYVGTRLGRRPVAGDPGSAWRYFTLWWWCLAAQALLTAAQDLLGSLGLTNLPLHTTAAYLNILLGCAALWGLLSYLLYLFTGSRSVFLPLTVFYAAYGILLIYYVTASDPEGIRVGRWSVALTYSSQLTGGLFVVLAGLLVGPQILAALAYFTFFFRVRDRSVRYRVAIVSWSIIIWFGSPLVAVASGNADADGWQVAQKLIGLAAACLVLMAYLPPGWLKKRFGVLSVTEEGPRKQGEVA